MGKKITLLVLSIVLVLSILIGSTYSALFKVDEGVEQSYATGILEITSNATNNSVTLTNALPMEDSAGATSTPYTFKITNTGNLNYKFNVKFLSTITDTENMINPENIKIKVNDHDPVTLNSLTNGIILENIELAPRNSVEITLRVWLDINTQNTEMGKVFNAKIVTEGQAVHSDEPEPINAYDVLASLNLTDSIKTDTFDYTLSSCSSGCDEATVGIYSTGDDLGTSYFFRGDVENNYVKFGKWSENTTTQYVGSSSTSWLEFYDTLESCEEVHSNCTLLYAPGSDMYWRIIRINGDGTVRMIYDGIDVHANGVSTFDKIIARNEFGGSDDNSRVGYMYGTAESTDYASTHSNSIDGYIKDYLENTWYANNFKNTEYEQYIADAIYCNDRSLYNGTGIGIETTYYRAYGNRGILTCAQTNDRFTMNNSIITTLDGLGTNKKLNAPVGLITMDEVVLAGISVAGSNVNNYLANTLYYWTMTPSHNSAGNKMFIVSGGGLITSYGGDPGYVRPVISLNYDALQYSETSNGSKEYPFVVG